jgi:hypothetical protein
MAVDRRAGHVENERTGGDDGPSRRGFADGSLNGSTDSLHWPDESRVLARSYS